MTEQEAFIEYLRKRVQVEDNPETRRAIADMAERLVEVKDEQKGS